ncbi:InlB B-repeat-containing protein [Eisenbergiella porci]|uniref:InlB B-repeat-containing protein n=1 Tax=Eisenbergiella porci TaxID=2652274 RepID=UPI002A82B470|nr:hypothetical protein [Eisenbergiella porci]
MKKAKHLQRFWAFLLTFVLVATTIGSDSMSAVAAENETVMEETEEVSESKENNIDTSNVNTSEQEIEVQEGQDNADETVSESPAETTEAVTEENTTVESSETMTEETVEASVEESAEEEENSTQASEWKISFHKEGDVKIIASDSKEIGDEVLVEKGNEISFRVEASVEANLIVKADGNEITPDNGNYKLVPEKDMTIEVKASVPEKEETVTETVTVETETESVTETEEESITETEIESTEIETETKGEIFVVSFNVENGEHAAITDEDGNEIGETVEVEAKKSLTFFVDPDEGYEVASVEIGGSTIVRDDNKYAVSPSEDMDVNIVLAEKEEEEEEYVETIDTVVVNGVTIKVATYSDSALPKGYRVSAKEVDAAEVKSIVEDRLEEKGKELNQLRAFDISLLDANGNEIQPKGGVSVQILGAGVEGDSFSVYHISDESDKADSVTEGRESSDVGFTANSFSIYVIAGENEISTLSIQGENTVQVGNIISLKSDKTGNYHRWESSKPSVAVIEGNANGQNVTIRGIETGSTTITHHYKSGYSYKSESIVITVVKNSQTTQKAYFYVLKPSAPYGSTLAKDYFYVGQGTVQPFAGDNQNSPTQQHKDMSHLRTEPNKDDVLKQVQAVYQAEHPNETIEVTNVIWYKIPWANGANSNNETPFVPSGTKCYHVDGYVEYTTVTQTTATFFYVKSDINGSVSGDTDEFFIEQKTIDLKGGKGYVTAGDVPSLPTVEDYTFVGWYKDKECTIAATWSDMITSATRYYAKYVPDTNKKEDKSYKVMYYKDGTLVESDTQTVVQNVWVGTSYLTVDKSSINTTNKYSGYKFDRTEPTMIPDQIAVDGIIKVYYVKDETKTTEVKYTVQHWVDGVHQEKDDVEVTKEVWVNAERKLEVTEGSLALNKYPGYTFSSYDPVDIKAGTVVADKTVIKVNYVRDDEQTTEVKYTVQHWVDGVHQEKDDVEVTKKIWVNAEKKLEVTEGSLALNNYPGYTFSSYDPVDIKAGKVVADGAVIKVNYVRDDKQTTEVKYTVQHWVDGVHQEKDDVEVTKKIWVNAEKKLEVTEGSLALNNYPGYTFSSYDPADIKAGTVVADKAVIKVNYVRDDTQTKHLSYTVEYWVEGEASARDTYQVSKDVWVNDPDTLPVENIEDKEYPGYRYTRLEYIKIAQESGKNIRSLIPDEDLPETVNNGDVIKIIYTEKQITIIYTADTNGNVTNTDETLNAVTGEAKGSTATANNGYHFVNWTNEAGDVVSTDAAFIPAKVDGLNVAAVYTAHFAANPVTPPDEPDPNPNPDPTPGTTPTPTPATTTAVLGESFAPLLPDVGVLGEAAAPEVGVLGESKGPGTGDTAPIAGWSFLIMGAILTLGITNKKRKKNSK